MARYGACGSHAHKVWIYVSAISNTYFLLFVSMDSRKTDSEPVTLYSNCKVVVAVMIATINCCWFSPTTSVSLSFNYLVIAPRS